jgi:hypothetical protein|nr:MAG TPA: hypothetical protein [Caudoviricetes sp.]
MFLSIVFAIFVWPAIAIAGLIALGKEIGRLFHNSSDSTKPTTIQSQRNIHYETPKEEERRTNYWGMDDERWGKL